MDFFDIKGDVERLLALRGHETADFEPLDELWAHPGASARVMLRQRKIGWCGALHPNVLRALDVDGEVFAFELDLEPLQQREVPQAIPISRFPSIRRDLSFWVPEAVTFAQIRAVVVDVTGNLLQNLVVFDVYQDNKLKKGYKSVAIGLIFQNVSSNLSDEMIDPVIQQVIAGLQHLLDAHIRG